MWTIGHGESFTASEVTEAKIFSVVFPESLQQFSSEASISSETIKGVELRNYCDKRNNKNYSRNL